MKDANRPGGLKGAPPHPDPAIKSGRGQEDGAAKNRRPPGRRQNWLKSAGAPVTNRPRNECLHSHPGKSG